MLVKDNYEADVKRATNIVSLIKSLHLNRQDLISKEKPTNKVDHMLNANKSNLNKLILSLEKSASNPDLSEVEAGRRKRKVKEISEEAKDIISEVNQLEMSIITDLEHNTQELKTSEDIELRNKQLLKEQIKMVADQDAHLDDISDIAGKMK